MSHLFIYPKNHRIRDALERLSKIESNHGRAIRIDSNLAKSMSHEKTIRMLSEKDFIDIAPRRSGPHRSIIYIDPCVKIKEKNGRYYFYF